MRSSLLLLAAVLIGQLDLSSGNGWLGISLTDQVVVGQGAHVVVVGVASGGPASVAGVLPGDVVVSLQGEPVDAITPLMNAVQQVAPGKALTFGLLREGALIEATAIASEPPTP